MDGGSARQRHCATADSRRTACTMMSPVIQQIYSSSDRYWRASTRQVEGPGRWFVMLMRTDPFRDLDRFTQQLLGTNARPSAMPMDAWRDGEQFVVEFDL